MKYAIHLGDGAYCTAEADATGGAIGEIMLTTGSHFRCDAGNVIYLDERARVVLKEFLERPEVLGTKVE